MSQIQQGKSQTPFEFHGNAREYFGIWIVNLLLSIVTFGIYSAWAKVRTRKYLHQNTKVAGRSFDYHATGMQILIGRIIVVVGLVIYSLLATIPFVGLIMLLGLLILVPWLLVRSLRFNARMSSWSNVRFAFDGSLGSAFAVTYLFPIGSALTLYTTWPFVTRAVHRFVINGHSLGRTPMRFEAPIGPLYKAMLGAIAWVVVAGLVFFAVLGVNMNLLGAFQTLERDPQNIAALLSIFALYGAFFAIFLPAGIIYRAMVRNVVYNNMSLGGGHRFTSNVSPLRLLWISVSNAVVVVCTLGLMLPWATIRRARYLADHTTFIPGASLEDFVDQTTAAGNSIGDAFGDIEGFDVDVAI